MFNFRPWKRARAVARQEFKKFETRAPSQQNAIDIFEGSWASNLDCIYPGAIAGYAFHFAPEPRIEHAARTLGRDGRFDGMRVLDLGPLEGGQAYQIEKLGGDVLSIEANTEAYLKCLVVKEITGMKTRFMLGDLRLYLSSTTERFDMVFASGVLYHMSDPISVIQDIARVTDKCFVWAVVYDAERPHPPKVEVHQDPRFPAVNLHTFGYGDQPKEGRFWGGIDPACAWMTAEGMTDVFRGVGFKNIEPLSMSPTDANGVVCFSASKEK